MFDIQARITAHKSKVATEGDAMNVDTAEEAASEELTRLQVNVFLVQISW